MPTSLASKALVETEGFCLSFRPLSRSVTKACSPCGQPKTARRPIPKPRALRQPGAVCAPSADRLFLCCLILGIIIRLHAGSQHHPKHDEDWEGPRLLSRRSFLNRTLGKADAVACVKKLGTRCDIEEDVRATHGGARPSSARPTPT